MLLMQLAKITYFLVAERLGALVVRVLPIPGRAPTETIVLGQKTVLAGNTSQNGDDLPPLISWLHGGPHATTTTAFNAQITGLALEGCMSNFLFFILLYTRKFAAVQLTVGGGGVNRYDVASKLHGLAWVWACKCTCAYRELWDARCRRLYRVNAVCDRRA